MYSVALFRPSYYQYLCSSKLKIVHSSVISLQKIQNVLWVVIVIVARASGRDRLVMLVRAVVWWLACDGGGCRHCIVGDHHCRHCRH